MNIKNLFAPSVRGLVGAARRAAMMLLVTMLTTATAWAEDVTLNENTKVDVDTPERWYVNLPKTGINTLELTGEGVTVFKVYDDGGSVGQYNNNCSGALTVIAPEGWVVQLSGTITSEKNYDKLTVYDGDKTSSPKIIDGLSSSSSGAETDINPVNSKGRFMTIQFTSDDLARYLGIDLTVKIYNPTAAYAITFDNPLTGTLAACVGDESVTTAHVNDVVTLTATPESGYLLSGISIVDANNKPVDLVWDGSFKNTATFVMPVSAVTITPTFTNTWTADGGLCVNVPKKGTTTVTIPPAIPSFKVYDDGGATNPYSSYCNGTLILEAPDGYLIRLSGSLRTERSFDNLIVYNGDPYGTILLDSATSATSDSWTSIPTVTSTVQSMALHFNSDGYWRCDGLNLTATLVSTSIDYDITNVIAAGGAIAVSVGDESVTTAHVNDVVTLTATPESGYLLNALSVVGEDGKPVNLNWDIWTNTATFIMPPSAVTITSNFVNTWTAAGGLYINMPQSDMKTIYIPTGVTSFKIYDDGGSKKPYSNNCNATITLVAPEGYVLQLSNSLMTEKYHDKLTVYDGSSAWSPTLIDALSSATTGSWSDIPTVNSTGQDMTINFYSNYSGNYAGLDLTVTLVDINTAFDITNVSAAGGTLAVSVGGKSATTAKVNEEVTLTAAPKSGYLLSGISVVAANGTPVSVNWEGSFKNTATFVMPASAVTITPTFTDIWTAAGGICVNMPKTGSTSVTIPAGIPSLKVYDDGGATGNYSNYCYSSITLTAPEGYVLQLSGKITTDNQGDALSVYDTYSTYISGAKSTFSDVQVSIPTVTSIDRDMTLFFYSTYSGNYAGLNLTVTLIKNVLTLEDGSDNSEAIETAAAISGKVYDVTLSGRTLYKDGSWNTLCLPFALNDFSGTPLEEAKVVTLGNSEGCNTGYANNTLNLEFLAASEIEAGVPYLVRWTKAEGYDSADPATRDIVDPVFTGVTIENETPADRSILSGDGYVDFVGTYSPVDFTADDRSILYLGTSNALYWPGTDMTLRAFRAYFQLKKDLTAGEILSARMYFGDSESETTSLNEELRMKNEEFATATGATATWYTLDGRKLSGKPTKKGVYINNGKKTVVK